MSGVTGSAHTSKEIVERLDMIAKAERRNRLRSVPWAIASSWHGIRFICRTSVYG